MGRNRYIQSIRPDKEPVKKPPRILTEAQAEKLDKEQARLNLQIEAQICARCGYHNGEVRTLSSEEIKALETQYAPPEGPKREEWGQVPHLMNMKF